MATDADAHRLRVLLEGSRGVTWADGRRLTPTVELGVRHDWGDAETGFGLEVGGRVSYADPTLGLTVEGTVRGLLAHEADAYKEWGASGSVRLDPGATGRGLSVTLAPTWGAAASGVEGLWSRQTTQGLAPATQSRATRSPGGGRGLRVRGLRLRAADAVCGHGAFGWRGPHVPGGHAGAAPGPDPEPGRHPAGADRAAGEPGPAAPGRVGLLSGDATLGGAP